MKDFITSILEAGISETGAKPSDIAGRLGMYENSCRQAFMHVLGAETREDAAERYGALAMRIDSFMLFKEILRIAERAARETFIKNARVQHPFSIVIVNSGGTYSLYGKDASDTAEILGISCASDDEMPTVSFSAEELDSNLGKLVRAGKKVTILGYTD